MGRDLGTYFVRVVLEDGRGWIQRWSTSARYMNERNGWFPLDAAPIPAPFDSEDDVINSVRYQFVDGNYSCDCNKKLFLWYASGKDGAEPESECGDELRISRLSVICPDGRSIDLTHELVER